MKMKIMAGVLIVWCFGFILLYSAQASTTHYWKGTAGQTKDWHTAGNWQPTSVPVAGDNAYVNNGGWAEISTADVDCGGARFRPQNGGGILLNGRTVTVTSAGEPWISSEGTYRQIGAASVLNANKPYVGANSVGTFILEAGTVNLTGGFYLGYINTGSWADGRYRQEGGSFNPSGKDVYVGFAAAGTGSFVINGGTAKAANFYCGQNGIGRYEQHGGTCTISTALYIGNNAGSEGTFIVSNGVANIGTTYCGNLGTGHYYQYGGSNTVGGQFTLGYNSGSTGTVEVVDGTLDLYSNGRKNIAIGYYGDGSVTIKGGAIIMERFYAAQRTGSSSHYTQSGGTTIVHNACWIGDYGPCTAEIMGGKLDVTGYFFVANNPGSAGSSLVMSNGVIRSGNFRVGGKETGSYDQYAGTNTASSGCRIGYDANGTGTVVIAGGKFAFTNNIEVAYKTNSTATLELRGPDQVVSCNDLDCNNGGQCTLKFVLEGQNAGINPIQCRNTASLDNANVTVEYDIAEDFRGLCGATYDLITTGSNTIYTNGCTFTNLSEASFSVSRVNGNKTLRLTLNNNYPVMGTVVTIR